MTPWGFETAEVLLYSTTNTIILDLYEENGEWDIAGSEVKNYSRYMFYPAFYATSVSYHVSISLLPNWVWSTVRDLRLSYHSFSDNQRPLYTKIIWTSMTRLRLNLLLKSTGSNSVAKLNLLSLWLASFSFNFKELLVLCIHNSSSMKFIFQACIRKLAVSS